MESITTAAELKNAIQLLEVEQAIDARNLKDQFYITYESLKPVNLFRNTLFEVISTPNLVDNILGTAAGLVTGYLSKKIVIGASGNILRKLFGSVMQLGVTNIVTQHPDTVKSIGQYIIQNILHKKRIEK
jgi:hypothetical protein